MWRPARSAPAGTAVVFLLLLASSLKSCFTSFFTARASRRCSFTAACKERGRGLPLSRRTAAPQKLGDRGKR